MTKKIDCEKSNCGDFWPEKKLVKFFDLKRNHLIIKGTILLYDLICLIFLDFFPQNLLIFLDLFRENYFDTLPLKVTCMNFDIWIMFSMSDSWIYFCLFQGVFGWYRKNCSNNFRTFWIGDMSSQVGMQHHIRLLHCIWLRRLHSSSLVSYLFLK